MHDFSPLPNDCWFLSGATASGKSAVSLELARTLGAEIISLDSMAVYRGMDIGTAKPTPAERQAIRHHLLDLVEPHETFSLAQYVEAAHARVKELRVQGRVPLFVGGTPLYLKSLLRGIFHGPPANWTIRHELAAVAKGAGPEKLHARLAQVDPISAGRLHPRDERRIIRALEVWETTGRSITELQQQFERARNAEACRVFVLDWPRAELHERINARVDAMFADGLVAEVQTLLARPHPLSRTASQAVGYREVIQHLEGERNLPATIELVKLRTRQFAKRQQTWFRSLSECRMIAVSGTLDVGSLVEQLSAAGAMVA